MKPRRWLVSVCGAALMVSVPNSAAAADPLSGVPIRAERPQGFKATLFGEKKTTIKNPAVVPLREAWESGAFAWSNARRNKYLNDAAVRATTAGLSVSADAQRAERDPASWLPSADSRCAYVAKWIAVKVAWGLSVDPAEASRLRTVSQQCSGTASSTPSGGATTTTQPSVSSPTTAHTTTTTAPAANTALSLLATIRIAPEYTAGYDRELFPHWKDLDGDGCDARENVLIRDSSIKVIVGTGCKVITGKWVSPYDGGTWTNPSDIDIDHVVALNEAWQSGAYAWTTQQRTNYANDLSDARTLMAVTDSVNQAKSDKDPAEWLPPLASYRCTYLSSWVAVKARWSLAMDPTEYSVVKSGIVACGGTLSATIATLPSSGTAPSTAASTATTAGTATTAANTVTTAANTVTVYVTPGAFCTPYGAVGQSSSGVAYTCKPSDAETRNRWRR